MILKSVFGSSIFACFLAFCPGNNVYASDQDENYLSGNNSFNIEKNWRSRPLGEKDFYIKTREYVHDTILQTDEGPKPFGEIAFVKDGIYEISLTKFAPGTLPIAKNPVSVYSTSTSNNNKNIIKLESLKKEFGNHFIGVCRGEWLVHPYLGNRGREGVAEVCAKHNIPVCQNRDEAYHLFELAFASVWGELQKAGMPIFPFHATFLTHWECRMGASITGVEIGGDERCAPMQVAFSRGASRQYNVPWATYMASWGGGIAGDSETRYIYLRPDERRISEKYNADYGAYSGTSLSMQKRFLYLSYMAGANMVMKEGDKYAFFANYDETTVDRTNPRVLVLQDRKTYLSPLGRVYKEFYDGIVKKHERGIAYTPIALLFYKNHGCILEYSQDFLIAKVPYQKADYQMRAIVNTVFPWEDRRAKTKSFETNTNATGPFGDIFDVLTSDVSEDVLSSYKALFLVGDTGVDAGLEKSLKKYVEDGGLLFMCAEQMTPALWELAGIVDTGEKAKDKGGISLIKDKRKIEEDSEFSFRKITLKGAVPIVNSISHPESPLATMNKIGKGSVIAATPEWLMKTGSKNTMLKLYSCLVDNIREELVPVTVTGDVQTLYNKNSQGWLITLINNNGVYKYPGQKELVKNEEAAAVTLKPKFKWTSANEWVTGKTLSELSITVPPGDIKIIEIINK